MRTKLTQENIPFAQRLRDGGYSYRFIGELLGVNETTILYHLKRNGHVSPYLALDLDTPLPIPAFYETLR